MMKETGYESICDRELLLHIKVLEDRKSKIDKQICLMKREMKRRCKLTQKKQQESLVCQKDNSTAGELKLAFQNQY